MKKRFSLIAMFALLVTVLASCASKYTIEFVEKNGTEIYEAIEVREGEVVELPADPTKDGLTFAGWYTNPGFTKEFAAGSVMPAESLVLYAKWVATLTFDSKGGTECSSITAVPGAAIELPTSTKEGYAFAGWFTDEAGTKAQTIVMPKVHTTVYAKWQVPNPNTAYEFGNIRDNDGNAYDIAQNNGEITVTAKETKGSWSFFYDNINIDASGYRIVEFTIVGTKDCKAIFKLQNGALADGSGVHATEIPVVMTGEEQKVTWVVNTNNLTASGGQMFLVFLNAGNDGWVKTPAAAEGEQPVKFEAAPYVTFKSVALYEAVDPGTTSDKYAIHFDSNGADPIESIVATKGAAVTLPTPTREGYNFLGWFESSNFSGEAYTSTTMPEEAVRLYANWEKIQTAAKSVSLINDTFKGLDENTYEFTTTDGVLKIKKTTNDAWKFAVGTAKGADIKGATYLHITLKGKAGDKIVFKVNDQGGKWEKAIDCDGTVQSVSFDISELELNENAVALCLFVNGEAGTATEIEVSELTFSNYPKAQSVVNDTFKGLDENTYEFTTTDGVLKIKKTTSDAWKFAVGTAKGNVITGNKYFNVTLKGKAGDKIVFKVNDQGGKWEKAIDCDGTVQSVSFDISELELNENAVALCLFVNGEAGTATEIEVYQLEFSHVATPLDLINDTYKGLDEGSYVFTVTDGVLKINKATSDAWKFAVGTVKGSSLVGYSTLNITLKGKAGDKIVFKVNDQGGSWEKAIDCDGTVQSFSFDVSELKVNENAVAICLFVNGEAGTATEIEVYELNFAN